MTRTHAASPLAALLILLPALSGCATLQEIRALGQVDFQLEGISGARLAGVDLAGVHSWQDLTLTQVARIVGAVERNELPLEMELQLRAENPASNDVDARLTRMEWALFIEDREAFDGLVEEEYLLEPGVPQRVPVLMSLDLVNFVEGSAQDLVRLALALAGQPVEPMAITLQARPTINTPLGAMRYREPISITLSEGNSLP
ncbi:MAG: hypothetical protein RQ745_07255 [Longimicrobiales bacterium]|nr:hypothetical protein [Longimicrobiales bacterium]